MLGMRTSLAVILSMIPLVSGCANGEPSRSAATSSRTTTTTTVHATRSNSSTDAAGTATPRARDHSATSTSSRGQASAAEDRAARAALAQLDLDERTGQLVMTIVRAGSLAPEELRTIRSQHLGGIIVFNDVWNGPAAFHAAIDAAQAAGRSGNAAGAGLLVATDQEAGPNRELTQLPPALSPPALATAGVASTRAAGRDTAAALARVGVNMDLAPVADLDAGPRHVMRGRAFGSDPAVVGPLVAAQVAGTRAGGGASVAKHFPGFGAASINSDLGHATVDRTRRELLTEELAPFRAAVDARVEAVMVSHGVYGALDPDHPASLSRAVVQGLLRDRLHYEGIAMTDSLNAAGVREVTHGTVPEACASAVAAGIDVVLLTGSMETARICRRYLTDAVRAGRIPRARIDEAALRVLRLKVQLGLLGLRD